MLTLVYFKTNRPDMLSQARGIWLHINMYSDSTTGERNDKEKLTDEMYV